MRLSIKKKEFFVIIKTMGILKRTNESSGNAFGGMASVLERILFLYVESTGYDPSSQVAREEMDVKDFVMFVDDIVSQGPNGLYKEEYKRCLEDGEVESWEEYRHWLIVRSLILLFYNVMTKRVCDASNNKEQNGEHNEEDNAMPAN